MGFEIERKFLVKNETYRQNSEATLYRQAYLCHLKERTVRVRVAKDKGFLTIKGATIGARRPEFEYDIPFSDAQIMIDSLCETDIVEKNRYLAAHDGMIWEVDEFLGLNAGLVVAEIELTDENQVFSVPDWVGVEITDDPKYYNSNLAKNPYCDWSKTERRRG